LLHALVGGGAWINGVHDGSRTVNCNNYPWNVNSNIGVRCVCDYLLLRLVYLRIANKDYTQVVRRLSRPDKGKVTRAKPHSSISEPVARYL